MNPRFRNRAVSIGVVSLFDAHRVEEREVSGLIHQLSAAGVSVRVDALGVLVVEGLTRDAAPHIRSAVEVLDGRERAVRRVLENATLFRPEAVAYRAKPRVETRIVAGKLEARPSHRRPDGAFTAKAEP